HCATSRPLPGARVRMRALAANRQVSAVPDPAIGLNFDQPADVHLDLFAEVTFDTALLLDHLTQMVHFVLGQVANLLRMIHIRFRRYFPGTLLANSIDGSQPDPERLLRRKIYTCDTCHAILLAFFSPGVACASG